MWLLVATLIVGWDDSLKAFLMLNSKGDAYGIQPPNATSRGYFYMSYDFVFHTKNINGHMIYDHIIKCRAIEIDSYVAPNLQTDADIMTEVTKSEQCSYGDIINLLLTFLSKNICKNKSNNRD